MAKESSLLPRLSTAAESRTTGTIAKREVFQQVIAAIRFDKRQYILHCGSTFSVDILVTRIYLRLAVFMFPPIPMRWWRASFDRLPPFGAPRRLLCQSRTPTQDGPH